MSFKEAITTCFNKYVTFSGRARRSEYWYFMLFIFLVQSVLGVLAESSDFVTTIASLFSLAVFLPNIAVTFRRLHDVGKSGWWILASFVPFLNIYLLVLLAKDSVFGANQYGQNPKGIGESDAPYAQDVQPEQPSGGWYNAQSAQPDEPKPAPVSLNKPAAEPQPQNVPAAQPKPAQAAAPAVAAVPAAAAAPAAPAAKPEQNQYQSPFKKPEADKKSEAEEAAEEAMNKIKNEEPDIIIQTVQNMHNRKDQQDVDMHAAPASYDIGDVLKDGKCRSCGAEINPGDKFCTNCGAKQ